MQYDHYEKVDGTYTGHTKEGVIDDIGVVGVDLVGAVPVFSKAQKQGEVVRGKGGREGWREGGTRHDGGRVLDRLLHVIRGHPHKVCPYTTATSKG